MTIPPTARGSKIVAMGHYQPAKVLTNADLTRIVDTTDEWITSRVGIKERRVAETETVADMATAAAGKALANAGLGPYDIDQVVVATCSSIDRCPNVACRVANNLGITAPAAFDLMLTGRTVWERPAPAGDIFIDTTRKYAVIGINHDSHNTFMVLDLATGKRRAHSPAWGDWWVGPAGSAGVWVTHRTFCGEVYNCKLHTSYLID